jgi:hypothetical protein
MKAKLFFLSLILFTSCDKEDQITPELFRGWNLIGKSFEVSVIEICSYGATLISVDTLNGIYSTYHSLNFDCTVRQDSIISYSSTKYYNDYFTFEQIKSELNSMDSLTITQAGETHLEWQSDYFGYMLTKDIGVTYITVADLP